MDEREQRKDLTTAILIDEALKMQRAFDTNAAFAFLKQREVDEDLALRVLKREERRQH